MRTGKLSRMGSQFTSTDFTSVLLREKIAISMDGRGAWRDNVFVEACPMIPRITGCCAVAFGKIRRGLPARLRRGQRSPLIDWPVSELLQQPQATFESGREYARSIVF